MSHMHPAAVRGVLKLFRWPSQLQLVTQFHSIPPWNLVSSHLKSSAGVSSTTILILIFFFYLNVYTCRVA